MNQPKYPLKFNVGFLLNQPIGTSRDIHFEYPELLLKPDLELEKFSGTARVTRTPQGVFLQGEFQGQVSSECVRCLKDFGQPLHTTFEELYAFDERSTTESDLILPEDGSLDIEELVREYLLIEVPISSVCKEGCKGLCLICGANLNEVTEPHSHPEEAI